MTDEEVTVERGPVDPGALIRSRQYRVILVFAAIVGVVVSLAAWAFLELVHGIQVGVYSDLRATWVLTRCRGGGRCRGWRSRGC